MPRKQAASNSSLGKQLMKTKQKRRAYVPRKDDEPMGGYKVVGSPFLFPRAIP